MGALVKKTLQAQKHTKTSKIVLAGGVAANSYLKEQLLALSPVPVVFPEPKFCTDNAAMIAITGYYKYIAGDFAPLIVSASARAEW